MSENREENSEMSELVFASQALKGMAPIRGSVKERLNAVARRLRWSASRTKDVWYADPRESLKATELRQIEEAAGVRYGKQELAEVDALIARAEALLHGSDERTVDTKLEKTSEFRCLSNGREIIRTTALHSTVEKSSPSASMLGGWQ